MSARRLTDAERAVRDAERAKAKAEAARQRELLRPHVAEWFGHRVYPTVQDSVSSRADQISERCPFLSDVAGQATSCVKSANSRGVCTISAGSNGTRQDWLVCPHRALDEPLLETMVRRLFGISQNDDIKIRPASDLANSLVRDELTNDLFDQTAPRQFLTFQQLFGGEISLPRSNASPELSFDNTVVEVLPDVDDDQPIIKLGRYGVIELQTTDTHGSYRHAVDALKGALDLHGAGFGEQITAHPDWPGRKVEGPNISNVFKRTFYQVMFKFQITKRSSSTGCILALPRPVWDSWLPFLGNPDVVEVGDGISQLASPGLPVDEFPVPDPSWIYVFDIAEQPPTDGGTTPVHLDLIIATDAPTMSRLALEVAPGNAIGDGTSDDSVLLAVERRMAAFMHLG